MRNVDDVTDLFQDNLKVPEKYAYISCCFLVLLHCVALIVFPLILYLTKFNSSRWDLLNHYLLHLLHFEWGVFNVLAMVLPFMNECFNACSTCIMVENEPNGPYENKCGPCVCCTFYTHNHKWEVQDENTKMMKKICTMAVDYIALVGIAMNVLTVSNYQCNPCKTPVNDVEPVAKSFQQSYVPEFTTYWAPPPGIIKAAILLVMTFIVPTVLMNFVVTKSCGCKWCPQPNQMPICGCVNAIFFIYSLDLCVAGAVDVCKLCGDLDIDDPCGASH